MSTAADLLPPKESFVTHVLLVPRLPEPSTAPNVSLDPLTVSATAPTASPRPGSAPSIGVRRNVTTIRATPRGDWHDWYMTHATAFSDSDEGPTYALTDAAALIGCSRRAINDYVIAGEVAAVRGSGGHWYLDEAGLAKVRSTIRPKPRRSQLCTTCLRAAQLLLAWGSGRVQEMTPLMNIHEGNIRKHLGHLAADGHAMRRLEGDWVLTAKGREWVGGWMKSIGPRTPDEVLDSDPSEEVSAPG